MSDTCVVDLCLDKTVKLSKWKVSEGTIVYDGRVLLIYEEGDKTHKFKSKHVGTVSKLLAKEGSLVSPGEPLLLLGKGCSHPTVVNDLCAECGADLQKDGKNQSQATIPMVHSIPSLKVSHEQAQKIGRADTTRLLKDRKLVLLVDLDQTLIHTTHDNIPNNMKDVHHFQLFGSGNPWYHTRLRPGTQKFLEDMSKYFELHICTFGVRPYAHMVAHILDKEARLFSNRILSRDECLHYNSKHANLKALFPCGDELVCIIDDREDVWDYSPNVIPVKPYHFFRNTGDIHSDPRVTPSTGVATDYLAPGVKVKEKPPEDESENNELADDIEVEEEDDYLIYLSSILKRVHKIFYNVYDKKTEGVPEVKWVIEHLRSNVLKDCELAFSGLIPLRTKLEESEPALVAIRLGAKISATLQPSTTHLIAAGKGTAKVHQAKKMKGIKVVNPHWLLTCSHRWERVDERLYDIGADYGPLPPQFCRTGAKGVPTSLITLSQEDMDAMAEEVGELSDSDSGEDENEQDTSGIPSRENSNSNTESSLDEEDAEEDLSLLGHQIEQGLSD
ncbi:RNA polymerase II subunit A C-terminal domain phosphatase-like [Halyomorpha halys]|uniref:RNA polymerase II subunit A C-terminal domain phosphatase-like n=1 Tax=Halyomorpha halys TaxID=286706 RepID=UPI0006D4DA1A|nr:RNA polymerase II subunit A C-terminal domain phosphatase isoform X1 [Halyomorpha halys]